MSGGSKPGQRRLLLGVDAGQTVTKAALFDLDGRQVAVAAERAALSTPRSRWVERDLDVVWASCAAAIRACLASADVTGAEVLAVGLCGHNDGLYAVDAAGRPTRHAVLAMDSRAHSYAERYRRDGVAARALPLTGQSPFAASPAAVYAWLRDHEPDVLERTPVAAVLQGLAAAPADRRGGHRPDRGQRVVRRRPTPRRTALRRSPCTSWTRWPGRCRRSSAARTWPGRSPPWPRGRPAWPRGRRWSPVRTTWTPPRSAWVRSRVGAVSAMMGTFSINQVVSDDVRLDHRWQARSFLRPDQWLNMSTSPASSTNLEWFVRTLCRDDFERGRVAGDPYGFVATEAAAADDGDDPVVFLPFLFGSPHGDDASAAFVGLRGWHDRGHLLRALLEGIVYVCDLEIHGTEGVIALPDPNGFDGPVRMRRGREGWQDVPFTARGDRDARGIGLHELVEAIAAGRPERASGSLALHVVDVARGILVAAAESRVVEIGSRASKPDAMPVESIASSQI